MQRARAIRNVVACVALLLAGASAAQAQPPALKPGLAEIGFLVGDWATSRAGQVQDSGGSATGVSSFTPQAAGAVLLRRDHVEERDAAGRAKGGFDIIMMVYPEDGTLHADYADGAHLIHYTSARVQPGHAVTFQSAASPGAPGFRLTYTLTSPDTMDVSFGMVPPGGAGFRPIATGVLKRRD